MKCFGWNFFLSSIENFMVSNLNVECVPWKLTLCTYVSDHSNLVLNQVVYDTNGFLEKNRDPMPSDSIQLLSSSSCELLRSFSKTLNQSQKQSNSQHIGAALDSQKQSVGTKFKVFLCHYLTWF